MSKIRAKVWCFGDNIDTDLIIAARYLSTSDPKKLALHVMEDADEDFVKKLRVGDIIVAGENFGCGSSREHAPIALKEAGVSAVIASSFARIFYRNAFNTGLPIFEVSKSKEIKEGSEVEIDMSSGKITDKSSSKVYEFLPIPPFMQELVDSSGLMNYAKKKLNLSKEI